MLHEDPTLDYATQKKARGGRIAVVAWLSCAVPVIGIAALFALDAMTEQYRWISFSTGQVLVAAVLFGTGPSGMALAAVSGVMARRRGCNVSRRVAVVGFAVNLCACVLTLAMVTIDFIYG